MKEINGKQAPYVTINADRLSSPRTIRIAGKATAREIRSTFGISKRSAVEAHRAIKATLGKELATATPEP